MGLDMYAYSVPAGVEPGSDTWDDAEKTELFYWRKFNALHGWMEDLYIIRGGKETFNCIPLRLYEEDLRNLLADSKENLTPREGFFWGQLTIYPEDLETVEKFVGFALAEIASGRDVYYDSWW